MSRADKVLLSEGGGGGGRKQRQKVSKRNNRTSRTSEDSSPMDSKVDWRRRGTSAGGVGSSQDKQAVQASLIGKVRLEQRLEILAATSWVRRGLWFLMVLSERGYLELHFHLQLLIQYQQKSKGKLRAHMLACTLRQPFETVTEERKRAQCPRDGRGALAPVWASTQATGRLDLRSRAGQARCSSRLARILGVFDSFLNSLLVSCTLQWPPGKWEEDLPISLQSGMNSRNCLC